MKKRIITILIISLVVTLYALKMPQTGEILASDNNILQTPVDNFLIGNLYIYNSYYDKENQLQTYLGPIAKNGKNKKGEFVYGIHISFTDSIHYSQYYTAPCGNDCFFETNGKYYLPNENELILIMDSTTYSGMCSNKNTEYGTGKKEIYQIIRSDKNRLIQLVQASK